MITGKQSRAARMLLGWSHHQLAHAARVGERTVSCFERGATKPIFQNHKAIEMALKTAGIRFIGQTGVDLPLFQ